MVKILLSGCCGKMGTVISNLINKYEDLKIVGGIDKNSSNKDYPIFSSPKDCNINFDVLLDFSRAEALKGLVDLCKDKNKPIVLCTTGYSEEDLNLINETSKVIPVFKSANMSVGINLLNIIARKVAPILYENFDIEIIEKHHNQKVDAPSGTALLLADSIKNSLKDETHYKFGREGIMKREKNEIGIHAIRGGSIVGDHDIIFAGEGEVIELSHKAISRDVFAVGALKSCRFMAPITTPGLYNMEDVLGLDF